MDFENWLEKNNSIKGYAHFDNRVGLKNVIADIIVPDNIIHHAFLPFIHYSLVFHKFSQKGGRKDKVRQLYYSSHYDRCIYQYYSYLLNENYNLKATALGINEIAIAYRTNLGKNNIHFAKEAFDFIKQQQQCYIIVGDFKDFFDSLDHLYLKTMLKKVLDKRSLPEDYYKVFKSITNYSYVNLEDVLKFYSLDDTIPNRRKLNSLRVLMPIEELRLNKNLINKHNKSYGIPQGSAISAILSNIYMLDFDVKINNYIQTHNGKYLRYSDDSIFIIPSNNDLKVMDIHKDILSLINTVPNLILQTQKTKIYSFANGVLTNCDSLLDGRSNDKNIIDYLGFSFDGKNTIIRDKTISKYYYRAYKKVDTIVRNNGYTPKGKKISCKNLYKVYTYKGSSNADGKSGNFLSYAKRSEGVFGKDEKVNKVLHTHFGKIKHRLNRIGD